MILMLLQMNLLCGSISSTNLKEFTNGGVEGNQTPAN
jgi:hypothetical protein